MKKIVKIINNDSKEVLVGCDMQQDKFLSEGYSPMDVEQAYNGKFYLEGFCPAEPYTVSRTKAYPAIGEQLDMIYWDKVNGTNLWQEKIAEIKAKYPKN